MSLSGSDAMVTVVVVEREFRQKNFTKFSLSGHMTVAAAPALGKALG
jgi:hypothetical protein